jgi:ketosteroid isomerase-like protein
MKTLKRAIIFLCFCGMIVFWGSQAIGEDLTAEQKELWAAVQANWETFKKGDVEAALAIKHDEMIAWFSTNPKPVKKEFLKYTYNDWFSYDKPISVKLEPINIHIFNNVANVFYIYNWSGNIMSQKSRMLETWVKQDNRWLMIGSLASPCDTLPPCP